MKNILSKLSLTFFIIMNMISFINIIDKSILSKPLHISIQITLILLAIITLINTMINFYESKSNQVIKIASLIIQVYIIIKFINALSSNQLHRIYICFINPQYVLNIFKNHH